MAKNDFSQGKMWRNILNQAIPLTIAQAVQVLYNVVDRIYLGHLPGASSLALTGVGLIFPIVALVMAFGNLFATGGTPLCSIARGAGEQERAEKIMNNTFSMLILSGLVLTVLGYCFRKPILYLFGAGDETYPYADAYLQIYLAGTVCSMISMGSPKFTFSMAGNSSKEEIPKVRRKSGVVLYRMGRPGTFNLPASSISFLFSNAATE